MGEQGPMQEVGPGAVDAGSNSPVTFKELTSLSKPQVVRGVYEPTVDWASGEAITAAVDPDEKLNVLVSTNGHYCYREGFRKRGDDTDVDEWANESLLPGESDNRRLRMTANEFLNRVRSRGDAAHESITGSDQETLYTYGSRIP